MNKNEEQKNENEEQMNGMYANLLQFKSRPIYTNGYDSSNWWSIGTNGTIGTNRKAPYSNGSIGEHASH